MQEKSNQKFVQDLMQFSKYGPIAEAFVLGAIERHASEMAAMMPDQLPRLGLVSPELLIAVAKEVKQKLDDRHGLTPAEPLGHAA